MIVPLAVPYTDSSVADLRFLSEAPPLPVLDAFTVEYPGLGASLTLRLLGASHQALLHTPGGRYAETLACLPDTGDPPPVRHREDLGDWDVRFRYRHRQLDPARFHRLAAALRRHAEGRPHTLLGRFPGHPDAMTCLSAHPARPGWATVHAYPETGDWVHTRTVVTGPGLPDPTTLPHEIHHELTGNTHEDIR
ncbi:uncharacterized protein DUF2617 [Stackebrandtia albiflava]|uniref:Uncharacterized protein DUF2617 n=1 Tax=Stackebrandtia albiflava TaxID=406432 RepID=A0A562UYA0_9ACTN|nr:DUF2617 family protein [Stackebrandtia albiflava]TWJ10538.1 uncharacterized protein DUF2617 [Stackebrandtia albiflava]